MPITFSIDYPKRQLNALAVGPIGFPEMEAHLIEERKAHGLSYREFVDARQAVPKVSAAETRRFIALILELAQENDLGRTAVLVSTDFAFGLVMMVTYMVSDVCEIRPYRDEQEAKAWLAS